MAGVHNFCCLVQNLENRWGIAVRPKSCPWVTQEFSGKYLSTILLFWGNLRQGL
jgi:hypothetical protein